MLSSILLRTLAKCVWIGLIGALVTVLACLVESEGAPTARGGYWLACGSEAVAGAQPVASVLSSGIDSMVVRLTVPGLSVSTRSAGGKTYSMVQIPGEGWLRAPGKPMVPQVVLLVACPEFDDLGVVCRMGSQTVVEDVLLYPSPCEVMIEDGGTLGPAEEFCMDEDAYASHEVYPAGVEILSIGRIRDQKVVWLGVCPVQYNAAEQRMVGAGEVTITLSYANSRPSLATRGTGPFEDICRRLLVGYRGTGGTNPMALLSAGGGQVMWAGDLQDCIDNDTDYLVVAAEKFCSGADRVVLERLANFRADSCGFNVSIIKLTDIGSTDTTLKSFIKDLYDSRSAAHWWDGHVGFVLLVGDYQSPNDSILMPRHLVPSQYGPQYEQWPDSCASDNWYACVAGADHHPDVMLGRMSVDNGVELENVIDKILRYEPLPDGPGWSTGVFLTAGTARTLPNEFYQDTLYVNRAFEQIESTVEADGSEVSILRGDLLGPSFPDLTGMNADSLEPGKYFVNYLIHADPFTMGYQPNKPKSFTACSVDTLANYGNLCVFTNFGCQSARFDVDSFCVQCPTTTMYDCIGERFLNTDNIGAVAYIGQTDMGDLGQIANMDVDFYEAVFKWHDPVVGMALVETLFKQSNSTWIDRLALLGDPALRIRYRDSGVGKWDLWARADSDLIWFEPPIDSVPVPCSTKLKVAVKNMTSTPLDIPGGNPGVPVTFWISDTEDEWDLLGTDTLRVVGPWDSAVAEVSFSPRDYPLGKYDFKIQVDPDSAFAEADEDNNQAIVTDYIGFPPSSGTLPSTPSDHPALAYLEGSPGSWYHCVLFPCENSRLYSADGEGRIAYPMTFNANDGPLHTPAVGDLEGDSTVLAVVASQHKVTCVDLFAPDPGRVKWSCDLGDTVVVTPPCITDLDGDGEIEVSIGARDPGGTAGSIIRIEHGEIIGTPTGLGGRIPSCPLASIDLSGDGKDDLLAGTSNGDLIAIDGSTGQELAYRHVPLGSAIAPVVAVKIGDLDMDGSAEVVAAAGSIIKSFRANSALTYLRAGGLLGGSGSIAGLAIADVFDDPSTLALEIVVSDTSAAAQCSTSIRVFDYVGHPSIYQRAIYGVKDHCTISDPIVADLSADDGVEIVFFTTTAGGKTTMWMWNANSDEIKGFLDDLSGPVRSAVLCDFENDLHPEIIFATPTDRLVWAATGNGNGRKMEWQMALGDERGRNLYAVALKDTLAHGRNVLWGRYVVSEDVWLAAGDTLEISPGTKIGFVPSAVSPPSLVCRGTLRVIGRQDAPIILTSADPTPEPGDWGGLQLKWDSPGGTRGMIDNTVIEYGTNGVDVVAADEGFVADIHAAEFRYNEAYGVSITSNEVVLDTLLVDDCTFMNNVVGGVYVGGGVSRICHSRFVKDDSLPCETVYGIRVDDAAGCTIEDARLEAGPKTPADTSCWDYGVSFHELSVGDYRVTRSFIESFYQTGIEVHNVSAHVYIDSNCVRSGSRDSLHHQTLVGMKFNQRQGGVDTTYVRANIIFQNCYGIYAGALASTVLGDTAMFDGMNHVVGNTYDAAKVGPESLKAEMCWWGGEPNPAKFQGVVDYSPWLTEEPAGIEDKSGAKRSVFALAAPLPNPLIDGEVRLTFSVGKACKVDVEIFNILGQRVRVLRSGPVSPGWHELTWDGRNERGEAISPGVYFCRLETPEYKAVRKVVVLK